MHVYNYHVIVIVLYIFIVHSSYFIFIQLALNFSISIWTYFQVYLVVDASRKHSSKIYIWYTYNNMLYIIFMYTCIRVDWIGSSSPLDFTIKTASSVNRFLSFLCCCSWLLQLLLLFCFLLFVNCNLSQTQFGVSLDVLVVWMDGYVYVQTFVSPQTLSDLEPELEISKRYIVSSRTTYHISYIILYSYVVDYRLS